jgi:hypothetical protein
VAPHTSLCSVGQLLFIFSANTFLSPNQDIGIPESKITTSVQYSKVPLEQARSFLVTLETCWAEEGT